MKVKSIKVLQGVKMGRYTENIFPNQKISAEDIKMEIMPNAGVLIKSSDEAVLVPFTNITAINMEEEHKTVAKK